MTEFASHYDERCRQISKSSSDARIIAQKIEDRDENFTSMNKEFNKKSFSAVSDVLCNPGVDDKTKRLLLEDYKKTCLKAVMQPSDSSYTRKVPLDATNSAEISPLVHNFKPTDLDKVMPGSNPSFRASFENYRKMATFFHNEDKRKNVENVLMPPHLPHSSETKQLNGVSRNNRYCIHNSYALNGSCNSEVSKSHSRDSSHLQQPHGSESKHLSSGSRKSYADLEKPFAKYISPVQTQNHISPALNYALHTNSQNSTPSSQKIVVPKESLSRPNPSALGEEENSNDDKSLAVNFSNPVVSTPTPEKPRYPYSIEMREGMFRTVKEGPDHETLRIHIIENYGSGDLRDGGFSWGWSIERRSSVAPPSRTSSSMDRTNSSANKDIHRSKRKLEYEKTSGSPTPKKSRMKGSDDQDTKINSSSKTSVEGKSKSSPAVQPKHSSPHIKPNSVPGERLSLHGERLSKSLKYSHADVKNSPNIGKSQNFDRHSGPVVSPVEKRKTPIYVPSSEMIAHLSKTDCSGKNSVIDDSTMGFISSKKERSAVYSGRKSALEIQPLRAMCFESVKKNILGLKIGKNVPFAMVLPALKLCSPSKLHKIEEHNRHILRFTDGLWKKFCLSEFRDQKPLNGEAWKDVYWRARNLREAKLKNLAASISNGMSKAHPERQAKWVGVGIIDPEKRLRKNKVEEIHNKSETSKIEIPVPKPEVNGKGSSGLSATLKPIKKRSESESSSSNSPHYVQKPTSQPKNQVPKTSKKPLAPLMSKTKKMLNLVNRRR